MTALTQHPTNDELAAFSSGQLPPDVSEVIVSHIDVCDACCDTLLSLSGDDTFVQILREVGSKPDETAELRSGRSTRQR